MNSFRLDFVDGDRDYPACFEVMHALRPHLADTETFAAQTHHQSEQGYRLLAAWRDHRVVGLAGYRIQENLLYGRFLYIDDLVTVPDARRQGLGGLLVQALREAARERNCAHLVLDTALGNALAQRFYFRQGLLSRGLHFSQTL
jgi:ribosomal protein S18 acetylase RimI-like enzyme